MKSEYLGGNRIMIKSLSSRRAWIEIRYAVPADRMRRGRSPRGGRGLKYIEAMENELAAVVALLAEGVD